MAIQSELSDTATEQRFQAIGRVAGGVAHDFNTLLSVVLSHADSLLNRADLAPDAAEEARQIRDGAARGAALVRQILATAPAQPPGPAALRLDQALGAMLPLLRQLVGPAIQLVLDAPGPVQACIDPVQFDQIVMNLVCNARDAMKLGGQLHLGCRPEAGGVVISVADNGAGIAPDVLPRIFDPFFSTRLGRGGNGLGLSTVRDVVRRAGGRIGVESALGQGSCFRVWLPRYRAAQAERSLLFVDDEAALLRVADGFFTGKGWRVLTAECGESALELLAGVAAPAVVISDFDLPGMDGASLLRHCRQHQPDGRCILASGYADPGLQESLAAEGIGFLPKPYGLAELLAAAEADPGGCS